MQLPFETHKIYITLDDEKMYQLFSDFSKIEVDENEVLSPEILQNSRGNGFMVIHKQQFDYGKSHLLNKSNPNRISKETAETYCKIGFITKEELDTYLN